MAEAEALAVELRAADGPLTVRWDPSALAGGEPKPWKLAREPDWDAIIFVRILSASLEDGTLLGAAALRPSDASDHGADSVAAALRGPEGDSVPIGEALLSTEYGPEGTPRRLGLELWPAEDGLPLRVAAELETHDASGSVLPLTVRSEGLRGTGLLHLLER